MGDRKPICIWTSDRAGLYRFVANGDAVGLIERGAETRRWWWEVTTSDGSWVAGNAETLTAAKALLSSAYRAG